MQDGDSHRPRSTGPQGDGWPVHPGRPPGSTLGRFLSVVWALVPVLSLGLGTAPAFTYAAVRLKSRLVGWWTAFYWVALGVALAFDYPGQALPETSVRSQVQEWIQWVVLILLGTVQAFLVRRRLLDPDRYRDGRPAGHGWFRHALGAPPAPADLGVRDAWDPSGPTDEPQP